MAEDKYVIHARVVCPPVPGKIGTLRFANSKTELRQEVSLLESVGGTVEEIWFRHKPGLERRLTLKELNKLLGSR